MAPISPAKPSVYAVNSSVQKETDISTGETSSIDQEAKSNEYEDRCEGRVLLYSLFVLLQLLGIVLLVLIILYTKVYLGGFAWDGSGKMFNWHPVFMTVGLVFLYGNAAVIYRVLRDMEKFTVKLIHASLNIGAFVFTIMALIAVFGFHNHKNIPNMYSLHSWVGMSAVVLYGCQLLMGVLGFLYPMFGDDARKQYLTVHVFFGGAILVLVVGAALTGLTEKMLFAFKPIYPKFPPVGIIANMYGIILLAFWMIVGYILHNRDWKRVTR